MPIKNEDDSGEMSQEEQWVVYKKQWEVNYGRFVPLKATKLVQVGGQG